MNWITLLIALGILIAGFFFEYTRDLYEEVWEYISEGLVYLISLEWLGDLWDLMGVAFEGISEFSIIGIGFGIMGVVFTFLLRKQVLESFTQYMTGTGKLTWTILTYLSTFIGGYLIGKYFENT